jgi:hypothetical protein
MTGEPDPCDTVAMQSRGFLDSTICVFASGNHLTREQLFLAAARLHVKPAVLQTPVPHCTLVTNEEPEAHRFVRDAQDVGVDAWLVTSGDLARADRARRVVLRDGLAEMATATRIRTVVLARLASLVDLRWKAESETRVLAIQPDEGGALLVSAKDLEVDGPSRAGGILKVQLELQQAAMAAEKHRFLVHVATPHQLGVPLDTPADVIALALVEGVRRRSNR